MSAFTYISHWKSSQKATPLVGWFLSLPPSVYSFFFLGQKVKLQGSNILFWLALSRCLCYMKNTELRSMDLSLCPHHLGSTNNVSSLPLNTLRKPNHRFVIFHSSTHPNIYVDREAGDGSHQFLHRCCAKSSYFFGIIHIEKYLVMQWVKSNLHNHLRISSPELAVFIFFSSLLDASSIAVKTVAASSSSRVLTVSIQI